MGMPGMMPNMAGFGGPDGGFPNFAGMNMMPGMNMPGATEFGMSPMGMPMPQVQMGNVNTPMGQQPGMQRNAPIVPGAPTGPAGGFRGSIRGRGGAVRGMGAFRGRGGARELRIPPRSLAFLSS